MTPSQPGKRYHELESYGGDPGIIRVSSLGYNQGPNRPVPTDTDEHEEWRHGRWFYQRFVDKERKNLVMWRCSFDYQGLHRGKEILQMWVNGVYVGREETWGYRYIVLNEMYKDYYSDQSGEVKMQP